MRLELITRTSPSPTCATPVLFVHGAWHGAWCWDAHFLPYFAERGFAAHALSFRNHGHSESVGSLRWRRGAEYVRDLAQTVDRIGVPPVLVGHSMGGYVVQKYLEQRSAPAVVLLGSVPPQGALGASVRVARRRPRAFFQSNVQARLWPLVASPELAREALFTPRMPAEEVRAYQAQLQDEAYLAYLDMVVFDLPHPERAARVPMLVLGGAEDALFPPSEARSTARAYRARGAILAGMPHDLMLEPGWQRVADRIITWLHGVPGVC